MSAPESHAPYSWTSLGRGGLEVEASAKREALELARALAAQTIVIEHDAVAEELPDRMRAIAETMWPASPLSGYGLHSSLGGYLVARVAVGWAPSGMIGLRREPFDRTALIEDLVEHGVDRGVALGILGDWRAPAGGFIPDPQGLDTSHIAGLVEGALSVRERSRALSQVAYSSRCLDRLASTASVLSSLRHVLVVLPPDVLGRDVVAGMTALALGRPDRALELIGERPRGLAQRTLAELARAIVSLEQGDVPILEDVGAILQPRAGDPVPHSEPIGAGAGEADAAGDDGDDVLEIIEERVDDAVRASNGNGHTRSSPPERWERGRGGDERTSDRPHEARPRTPRPPRWSGVEGAPDPLDPAALDTWRRQLEVDLGLLANRRGLLGLRLPPARPTVAPWPLPPDERIAAMLLARASGRSLEADTREVTERIPVGALLALEALEATGTTFDAVFPPVRGVLRAIVRAPDGVAPSAEDLAAAGDLEWVLLRAKSIALIVTGDLEGAVAAVRSLPSDAAPEGRWAADRLRRFAGRRIVRATPEEARPAAAGLVMDLAHQLGRTLAGTLPVQERA